MRHTKQPLDIATVVERIILVLTALMLILIMSGCEAYQKTVGSRSVQAGYSSSGKATLSYTVTYR